VAALLERLAQHQLREQAAQTGPTNMAGRAAAGAVPPLPRQLLAQTAAMVVAAAVAGVGAA
jgi:hypothetical protein